ncbi:28840_t:CDS:1, partial [Racocetra persica]
LEDNPDNPLAFDNLPFCETEHVLSKKIDLYYHSSKKDHDYDY